MYPRLTNALRTAGEGFSPPLRGTVPGLQVESIG
jgi:hypothetical protein